VQVEEKSHNKHSHVLVEDTVAYHTLSENKGDQEKVVWWTGYQQRLYEVHAYPFFPWQGNGLQDQDHGLETENCGLGLEELGLGCDLGRALSVLVLSRSFIIAS